VTERTAATPHHLFLYKIPHLFGLFRKRIPNGGIQFLCTFPGGTCVVITMESSLKGNCGEHPEVGVGWIDLQRTLVGAESFLVLSLLRRQITFYGSLFCRIPEFFPAPFFGEMETLPSSGEMICPMDIEGI
jgi:hypothetical protein